MNKSVFARCGGKTLVGMMVVCSSLAVKIAAFADESTNTTTQSAPMKLLREGSRIEKSSATIRAAGERLTLTLPNDERNLTALENLAAQRILKAVVEDPSDNAWTIDGSITEFNDRNFILIERAQRGSSK